MATSETLLDEFTFTIKSIPGKDNNISDQLSKRYTINEVRI
jgi:hypothetical protein